MAQCRQIQKISWWHEAIVDWMLANPGKPLRECAEHFGKSQTWISIVINSDIFKALFAERRRQFTEGLHAAIQTRTQQTALKSLEILDEALTKKRDTIPFDRLADATDKLLSRLGYGAPSPGAAVQVNVDASRKEMVVVPVSSSELEEARRRLRAAEAARLGAASEAGSQEARNPPRALPGPEGNVPPPGHTSTSRYPSTGISDLDKLLDGLQQEGEI